MVVRLLQLCIQDPYSKPDLEGVFHEFCNFPQSLQPVLGQCVKVGHHHFIPDNLKYPTTNLLFDALSKQID
jgi:hypothetical protein